MIPKMHDIIKGIHKIEKKPFIVRVSSLPSVNMFGVDTVEALTIFDKELRIITVDVLHITHNFGKHDIYEFAKKYPEYLI